MLEELRHRLPAWPITQYEIGDESPNDEASDGLWSHLLSGRYSGRHGDSRKS